MLNIDPDDPLAVAAIEAIRSGDLEALQRLLRDRPSLATARIGKSRTLLHVVTDWPGNFRNSASTVAALVASGAEVRARSTSGASGRQQRAAALARYYQNAVAAFHRL
jgi:hypothetical protein